MSPNHGTLCAAVVMLSSAVLQLLAGTARSRIVPREGARLEREFEANAKDTCD